MVFTSASNNKSNSQIDYSDVKILVVDDDPDIIEFVQYNLKKEGFQVVTATNGIEAIQQLKAEIPHLVLLDIMMPELDGVETCHRIRKMPEMDKTLITFLTARSEEYSQIAGLEAGADDYIQKPIRPRLLVSRIKALLRRHEDLGKGAEQAMVKVGDITINKESFEVTFDDMPISVARKEFDILCLLASKPGKVFSREEIYRSVWGTDVLVGNRTIDVHINKLRSKTGPEFIRTIKGIGYKIDF